MTTYKVSELTFKLLDKAVAKACQYTVPIGQRNGSVREEDIDTNVYGLYLISGEAYLPSERWDHGGPIIDREKISLLRERSLTKDGHDFYTADIGGWNSHDFIVGDFVESGSTPLIAAMRCFVAARFGEEVEI